MYRTVEEMLANTAPSNRKQAKIFWRDLHDHLPKAAGSTRSHHAWPGGYSDHVQEAMNLAEILYKRLEAERKLEFKLSSALLVLFLHDCEKPFRHATDEQLKAFPWIKSRPAKSDKDFQRRLVDHYGFELSDEEWNGLKYVEGEGNDYAEGTRTQTPLAAFCHVCDTISARIWHDQPKR